MCTCSHTHIYSHTCMHMYILIFLWETSVAKPQTSPSVLHPSDYRKMFNFNSTVSISPKWFLDSSCPPLSFTENEWQSWALPCKESQNHVPGSELNMSNDPEWPQANAVPALCSPTSKPTSHTAERKSIEAPDSRGLRGFAGSLWILFKSKISQTWQRKLQDIFFTSSAHIVFDFDPRLSHPYLSDRDSEAQGTWTSCDVACGRIGQQLHWHLHVPSVLCFCILSLAVLINRATF